MKTFTKDEIAEILRKHGLWLRDEDGGERANLRYANLRSADLRYANLRYANLRYANLSYANLSYADLRYANLRSADLRYANLRSADLRYANLSYANLRYANLRYANLRYANLRYANLSSADLRYANGQNNWLKTLGTDIWQVSYTFDRMQIGCESHLIAEWWEFDDQRISKMDHQALEFWNRWKPILQSIIENAPAQPTGKEKTK